jgi:hypothetical protein
VNGPNPLDKHPMAGFPQVCFIKNTVMNPNIVIGVTLPSLIATLEALLIEALEPPQNRKRGDDFSVMEYIQDIDPEIKERELQNTLRAIEQRLRGQS